MMLSPVLPGMLGYALHNAFRRRGRALFTIIAVMIGALTLTLTTGLGAGVKNYVTAQVAALGSANVLLVTKSPPLALLDHSRLQPWDADQLGATYAADAPVLTEADRAALADMPGVSEVVPALAFNPQYIAGPSATKYRFAYGGYLPGKTSLLDAGGQLDYDSPRPQIILPAFSVTGLGFPSPEAAIGASVTTSFADARNEVHELTAEVVGVQRQSLVGGNQPFVNLAFDRAASAATLIGKPAGQPNVYPVVSLVCSDVELAAEAVRGHGFAATSTRDTLGDFDAAISGVLFTVNALAAIAILAALVGVLNTMLMSIQERSKLIGLHRALGMSRRQVFSAIAAEAALLALVGALTATALGVGLGTFLGPRLLEAAGVELPGLTLFAFNPLALAGVVLGITAGAILAALVPAARAAGLQPGDAMRSET